MSFSERLIFAIFIALFSWVILYLFFYYLPFFRIRNKRIVLKWVLHHETPFVNELDSSLEKNNAVNFKNFVFSLVESVNQNLMVRLIRAYTPYKINASHAEVVCVTLLKLIKLGYIDVDEAANTLKTYAVVTSKGVKYLENWAPQSITFVGSVISLIAAGITLLVRIWV